MSKAQFTPLLALLALAGSKEAAIETAFEALHKGVNCIVLHGDKRTLTDTLTALAECKGAQGKRVRTVVQAAYDASVLSALAGKGAEDKGAPIVNAIVAAAALAYSESTDAAATARAAKAEETKAAKAKADKEAEKVAKAAAHAAQPRPLTLADAVAFFRAALASGSVDAGLHLEALIAEFVTFADETTPANVIDVQAREVAQPLALAH